MRHLLSALLSLVCLVAFSPGCQGTSQAVPQSARQDSGSPLTSPVDQGRSMVYAPVFITGSGTISGTTTAKQSADGDLRSAESLRTGAMATTLSATSTQTTTISLDPKAVAEAATAVLKAATPGGAAATLASQALDAANAGQKDRSNELLRLAQAAASVEAVPPK